MKNRDVSTAHNPPTWKEWSYVKDGIANLGGSCKGTGQSYSVVVSGIEHINPSAVEGIIRRINEEFK